MLKCRQTSVQKQRYDSDAIWYITNDEDANYPLFKELACLERPVEGASGGATEQLPGIGVSVKSASHQAQMTPCY